MTGNEHPHPLPASHTVRIAELIEVAQRLAPGRNRASIVFVGIEGRAFDEYGIELTRAGADRSRRGRLR
jgi:hypothetical protein